MMDARPSEEELARLEQGLQHFLGANNDIGPQLTELLRQEAPGE